MTELRPKPARESVVEMTHMLLPSDANPLNAAFGGKVMEWIDICAAIAAQRHCRQVVVTASMDDLHFHAPIKVGWTVTLHGRVLAAFRTSVEVGVLVHAENSITGERVLATSALLAFVALDSYGRKVAVPPLALETDAEREAFREVEERRAQRLERRKDAQVWRKAFGPLAD